MPPRKPSLNGGQPAIPSVPSFPEDYGFSSCPCSTLPPMPFPNTGTVLQSNIAACGSPCSLRPLSSVVVPHSHPIASTVRLKRMERKSFGFLKAYCSLFPTVVSIILHQFCERKAGLRMPLFIFILQREFSLSFRCRSGTPSVFVIMLTPLWFSSFRHLWVYPTASASARPQLPWCPMLYASARRSHGTTGRC